MPGGAVTAVVAVAVPGGGGSYSDSGGVSNSDCDGGSNSGSGEGSNSER